MSSMRVLSQMLKANGGKIHKKACAILKSGDSLNSCCFNASGSHTHCRVEWQESGNHVSVVGSKQVESKVDGGTVKLGDLCTVSVREGSKMVGYEAKILGMGKFYNFIYVHSFSWVFKH